MAKKEIVPIPSIEEAVAMQRRFYELCEKLLDDSDYAEIRGIRFRRRSGWAKLRRAIGISTKVTHEKRFETKNTWGYYFRVRAELPSGRYEEADGACSAAEFEVFDIEPTEHLVRSKALTRAKNRATSDLIAAGEVTYEEMEVREGKHWIDDTPTRKRFWGWARKTMGLTADEVHEALGVGHIRDFEGTFHEAKQQIVRWVGMRGETLEDGGKHWADNELIREAFWKTVTGFLPLSEEEVYEALGVSELREFKGTLRDAFGNIAWWLLKNDWGE